jgi:hypothetical protein
VRFTVWLAFVACSSHSGKPTPPTGSNAPLPDAGAVVTTPGPSERDCLDLVAHAVEIYVAEVKKTKPTQAPTADETAKIEADLRGHFLAGCRASTLEGQRCAMAATTTTELAACQPTPSSSTSNNSVAPPGITPAAPLSP